MKMSFQNRGARSESDHPDYDNIYNEVRLLGYKFEDFLRKDVLSIKDLKWLMGVAPPEIVLVKGQEGKDITYPIRKMLIDWHNAWMQYKEGKIPSNPLLDPMAKEWLDRIAQFVREDKAKQYGIMGATLLRPHSILTFDYDDYHPYFFLKWAGNYRKKPIDYGGNVCIIYGTQGSGKTSKALRFFVEGAISEGIKTIGNIQIEDDLEGYTYATRESDILLAAISNAMKGLPSIAIKDEQQLGGFDKTHTSTIDNQEDDAIIRLTRKLKLSEVRIWHEERKISAAVVGSTKMMIQCYGGTEENQAPMRRKATFKILKDGNIERQFDIEGIPNTTLRYKTDDPAPFIMDISITQIYQFLARIMGETTNEKSHYELLRDEILIHKKFYDETGKRVERKTLDEFSKWREEQKQKENKQSDVKQDVGKEEKSQTIQKFIEWMKKESMVLEDYKALIRKGRDPPARYYDLLQMVKLEEENGASWLYVTQAGLTEYCRVNTTFQSRSLGEVADALSEYYGIERSQLYDKKNKWMGDKAMKVVKIPLE